MVTWNPLDKNANVTLSNNDLTANISIAANGVVRATEFKSGGKFYLEINFIGSVSNSANYTGITTASSSLSALVNDAGHVLTCDRSGNVYSAGVLVASTLFAVALQPGDTVMYAIDMTGGKAYVGLNGNWLLGDPSSGTGGATISTAASVSACCNPRGGSLTTLLADKYLQRYVTPTGFSAYDPNHSGYWTPTDLATQPNGRFDAYDITAITLNGSTVSAWANRGSETWAATQGTASSQPAYTASSINGLPALTFDGSNDFLTGGTGRMPASAEHNYFVVFKAGVTPVSGTQYGLVASATNSSNREFLTLANPTDANGYWGYASASGGAEDTRVVAPNTITPGYAAVVHMQFGANGTAVYENGVLLGSQDTAASPTQALSSNEFRIGQRYASNWFSPFNGDIAEVIVTTHALTTEERQRIEGYLAWKYGLQSALDASNPYKSAAPTTGGETPAQDLTQTATFTNDHTFYGGEVQVGAAPAQSITQTDTFTNASQFYGGTVSVGAAPAQSITQTATFVNTNQFYGGTVSVGAAPAQSVTQTATYTNVSQFYGGTVELGGIPQQDISQNSTFVNAQTFYAGSVSVGPAPSQSITQTATFTNAQTFYPGTIDIGGAPQQDISQSATYVNAQTFYGGTVSVGPAPAQSITQTDTFVNVQVFYPGSVGSGEIPQQDVEQIALFINENTFHAGAVGDAAVQHYIDFYSVLSKRTKDFYGQL